MSLSCLNGEEEEQAWTVIVATTPPCILQGPALCLWNYHQSNRVGVEEALVINCDKSSDWYCRYCSSPNGGDEPAITIITVAATSAGRVHKRGVCLLGWVNDCQPCPGMCEVYNRVIQSCLDFINTDLVNFIRNPNQFFDGILRMIILLRCKEISASAEEKCRRISFPERQWPTTNIQHSISLFIIDLDFFKVFLK